MKATCISACEIPGVGIVRAGEEIELADGFYNDARIRTHFSIAEATVKDKNAKPPDMLAAADARRERFAKSLIDHTARIKALNALADFGAELPRELLETDREDAPTEAEQVEKIVQLWCDNFGYDFPTDEKKKPKGKQGRKNQGKREEPDDGREPPDEGEPGGGAQQSLFEDNDKQ